MPLDPDVVNAFSAGMLRGMTRQSDLSDQVGRDTLSFLLADQRCITAMNAREIGEAPTAQDTAALNTAARTPSTLDHYALGAGFPSPGAPAPGAGGAGGAAGKPA